ncbi:deoxyguanosinetriphosphate triphosphohydrolase [Magnetospira sp. QH-2]|uniref:deoxyguanosinetriphosphate triphosphohydrolase n=1 Tax=Magnetospira sp. (strain QH-2) TaxID=1288970 RepID=UPI0003E819E6|nr:deoxyguanosinetriphosphate triphosphohydrolase [Magnetospira sp. QH-2]CCQ73622.1 Putative deoxyguanosine triphosphate triphosphohydrolase [Magnetospira sp. QH-2]
MSPMSSLAPYACRPEQSRGRLYPEPESETRSCFQRDRDRIIHSAAFRRLEYKTQVFVNHEGDFFRTRLTHSLEVSQIARSVCRSLSLNEDMGEALALAHDLGHPPFGHAGEDALQEIMTPYGGFDHNAQSLKVVTALEKRYAQFDGLNLTWETLEGVVKHNGPLVDGQGAPIKPLPGTIVDYNAHHDLELSTYAGPEAQIAALSDDVAYNNHDIDDGLRAGLFSIADLADVPLVGPVFAQVEKEHPDIDWSRKVHEAVRRLIGLMVHDLLAETRRRIADLGAQHPDDIRNHAQPVAGFSEVMASNDKALKKFLFENMYRHYKVNRMTSKARRVVLQLATLLLEEPNCLPDEWQAVAGDPGSPETALAVMDYIAGKTDRAALDEHQILFDVQARTS